MAQKIKIKIEAPTYELAIQMTKEMLRYLERRDKIVESYWCGGGFQQLSIENMQPRPKIEQRDPI